MALGMFIQIAPLLIYFAGGFLIIGGYDNGLTVGDITIVVSLVNRLYQPVRMLLNLQVDFVRSLALFSRIFEYLDRDHEIENPENPLKPDVTDSNVEFCNVKFSYVDDKPVLNGVSFKVPSGKVYAIVGTSGAGKILLLQDGVIAEEGTHDELLEKSEGYRELYETQFRKVIDYEKSKHREN